MKYSKLTYSRSIFQQVLSIALMGTPLVALSVLLLPLITTPVLAEGSRSMYPSGATGNRANLDQRTTSIVSNKLKARTILKVYASAGEYILLGSSAVGVTNTTAGITTTGEATIYNPGINNNTTIGAETFGTASFSCNAQRTALTKPNLGRITSRAQELAGPQTITNALTGVVGTAITNAYQPCYYLAPTSGIYDVYFTPPDPAANGGATVVAADTVLADTINFDANQKNTVAAWDVTVRNSLTSTSDLNGRMFYYYSYLRQGTNGRYANFAIYPVTKDGYRYKTELNGLDPNSFAVYGNRKGFLNTDGNPLYHDVVATDDALNSGFTGGVTAQLPDYPIFLNAVDPVVLDQLNITRTPVDPLVSNLTYVASAPVAGSNNSSLVGSGGTFSYSTTVTGMTEIVISRNGTDFDPTNPNNRVLRQDVTIAGTNSIAWDGKNNSGISFPSGINYKSKITVVSGEYHFPLIDAENSQGGPKFTLLNPPTSCPIFKTTGAINCNIGYYDDRGYKTLNGNTVGTPSTVDPTTGAVTPASVLPGTTPPTTTSSGVDGFDTSTNQRAFGDFTGGGWGDKKGLDIWTYAKGSINFTFLNFLANGSDFTITKTHIGNFSKGQTGANYTLTAKNSGGIASSGLVTVIDTLPTGLTATAAAGTGWTCTLNTPAVGQVQCTRSDVLALNTSYPPITLTVNVAASVPDTLTNTATVSGGSQVDTTNDTASDLTKLDLAISGTVFADVNGSKIKNGTETGTNAGGLNAVLIDSLNKVTAVTPVAADGTYRFNNIPINTSYTVQITTANPAVGTDGPISVTLPATWLTTGENLNGTIDPTSDSKLAVAVTTSNVSEVNFGITMRAGLVLVKRITGIKLAGTTTWNRTTNLNDGTALGTAVHNPADTAGNDTNAKWQAGYLLGAYDAGKIKPGDELEYTIYYLNAQGADAKSLKICDPIRGKQTYTNGSMQLQPGGSSTPIILTDAVDSPTTDRANSYLPGVANVPGLCNAGSATTSTILVGGVPTATRDNGGVTIGITGSGSTKPIPQPDLLVVPSAISTGTPAASYGWFRFTTKVDP